MWNPFKKKKKKIEDKLSITGLFPSLKSKKRRTVKLNFGFDVAVFLGLSTTIGGVTTLTTTGVIVAAFVNILTAMVVSFAVSSIVNLFIKKPSASSVTSNGRQFNTKSTDEPLHLIYGEAKVGMNWVYCEESFKKNRHLNIAGTWGEGEIEGYGKAIDIQADYMSSATEPAGLNDLRIGGVYTGTSNIYVIRIDTIGCVEWKNEGYTIHLGDYVTSEEPNGFIYKCTTAGTKGSTEPSWPTTVGATVADGPDTLVWTCKDPVIEDIHDTFEWSKADDIGTPDATGVQIQANTWHTLGALGVKIKFHWQVGHIHNSNWRFFAGDGFWLGEKLADYYGAYKATPSSGAKDLVLFNTFHNGSATQVVDTNLSSARTDWNDALRNTAWQYLQLLWNDYAWNSIPEAKALIKGLKSYDPRTGTVIYHQNTALAALDFLKNDRYGLGIPIAEIDAGTISSFSTAATWYENNGFTFNGAIVSRQEFTENFNDILVNGRAFIIPSEGKYKYKIFADDTAVMTVTDDDFSLEEGITINQPGIPETPTKVKCIFIDKNKNYSTNFAEYPDTDTLVDNEERLAEIILIGTDNFLQAKRLAKYYYLRAKFGKTFSLLGRPRLFNLEPGDMITLTSEYLGFTAVKVRVFSIGLPSEGLVPLVLQEEDSSIYDLTVNTTEEEPAWISSSADKTADLPTGLVLLSTTLDEGTKSNLTDAKATLQWDWIADGVDYILQYREVGESNWEEVTKHDEPSEELMTLDVSPAIAWAPTETITGATSNKTCKIVSYLTSTTYIVKDRNGTFTLGEILAHGAHTADQGSSYPTFGPITVIAVLIKKLVSAQEYEWRVRSRQGKSLSEWADGDNFIAYDPNPPTMTGVAWTGSTPLASAGGISLSWTPTTDRVSGVDKYCIYRATSDVYPGDANFYATVPRASNSYQDIAVTPTQKYYYWINIYSKSLKYATVPYGSGNATAITATITAKLPIVSGDTWTDNHPSAGDVEWNAHTLTYNGVAYSVTEMHTELKYIWFDESTFTGTPKTGTYSASSTDPTLTDDDFLIAININGVHNLAWNAIGDGEMGYDGTIKYRSLGVPTNNPSPSGITKTTKTNGSMDIKIDWGTYTQGTLQADFLILFWKKGTAPLGAPTVNDSSICFNVNTATASYFIFEGVNPADNWSFGIAAARRTENGLEIGSIQSSTSTPDWQDVTEGSANYTANIGGETTADVVSWASDPAAKINIESTLILAAKVRLAETLDLELMKMNFQSISWSQFAIFDSFDDETKRQSPEPGTYPARVYLGQLDNGADATASRSFTFTSKTYTNITTVKTGTSTGVGSGYLEDTAASWFTDQYVNYELVDSASTVFTIESCTESPRRLVVTGTPASGAYTIRSGLPGYTVGFCSYNDSSTGGTGYTKLEVSFNYGNDWQTLLNTETSVDNLGGTVEIVIPERNYKLRLTIKNNASGNGAIVNKVLICTDPSVWA